MADSESRERPALEANVVLPQRVSGIVFWGLVLIGLLAALPLLQYREDQILQHQQSAIDRAVAMLSQAVARNPAMAVDELVEEARRLVAGSPTIRALQVRTHDRQFRIGTAPADASRYERILLAGAAPDGGAQRVQLSFLLPSMESQIATTRKNLVLGMGGLFLLFGLVLQRVLQRILTRPFRQMVGTVQALLDGDETVRFDTRRRDEFGYLGRFINHALDRSLAQRDALNETLAQARRVERELHEEKEKAVVTLHSIGDGVITTDGDGRIDYMNRVAESLTGWTLQEVAGSPLGKLLRLVEEESGRALPNPVDRCLQSGALVAGEDHRLLIRNDGEEVAIADSAAPICNREGEVIGAVLVFRDVGHARRLARQLSYQASHDPLTGLYNRREFEARLEALCEGAGQEGARHALCYIDLDQFKVVNDVCGHGAGDELLCQLAGLLASQIREADVLARLGGDEFGVLFSHCSTEQALRIAENIRSAVRDYRFLHGERSFEVGASIGVVSIGAAAQATEVLSAADIACYAAKDGGRNRVHLYEPGDDEVAARRGEMDWVGAIHEALAQERMSLLCQPVVPLGVDGLKPHFELLLRMRGADGGQVLPMAFIPAAERYNLMPDIDRWVVRAALDRIAGLDPAYDEAVFLINLSGQSLCDPAFVAFLEAQLARGRVAPSRLCFEIAERAAFSNLQRVGEAVARLRCAGCRFALDDFGGGLTSFSHLKKLAVDYLLIDGALVRDMAADEVDAAMVTAINDIGHVMGLRTVAKMVEDEETLRALRAIRVDFGQGYWIAPPAPLEELLGETADGGAVVA